MVRLTRLGTVLRYWQTGVLIQHPRKAAVALVELKQSSNILQVSVRGSDSTTSDMFCTMVELLEFLLVNWFRVQTDIIYIEPRSHATFTQQQLEEASLSGSWILEATVTDDATSMVELSHVVKVKMDAVAPELALNNLQALELDIEHDLKIESEIGEGAYATVYKATLLATNEHVAVKRLRMSSTDYTDNADIKAAFNEFRREVMVMSELKHPNIVKLIGFSLQVPFSMVMELAPFDALHKYLSTNKTLAWDWRLRVAYDIAEALNFLHSIDYQHRDLKSPNILIASEDPYAPSVAKVSDFGITGRMYAQQSKAKLSENREVQNPTWLAPEVLKGEGTTHASDVYAFGIILWELATLKHPFEEFDYKFTIDLEEAIKHGTRPTIPSDLNPALANLITECWHPTQKGRPSFSTIVSQRMSEILKQMVPDLGSKIVELKRQASVLQEKQRTELENALASQKQQMKHLEELRDSQLAQQESSDETGEEEEGEDDQGDDSDEDSDTESSSTKDKRKTTSLTADSGAKSARVDIKSPRESSSLTGSTLTDSTGSNDSGKRMKGSRRRARGESAVAALAVADLAGASFAAGTSPDSQNAGLDMGTSLTDASPRSKGSVSGMIRGAVTKLKKIGSASFGTAGDSTLGTSSSSNSSLDKSSDSIETASSPLSSSGGRGSRPGMLQSSNSTLGGILNDIFNRSTANGATRISLGGYWRMMEGELRDLIDQRGLLLDPSARQSKADLVQVLIDDDAAIAKMRITGMSSQSSENVLSTPRVEGASRSPTQSSMSVKGSAGTSLAMQFDAREANEKASAITSSFLASALWRRVKYYVTVSNSIYDLRGEPLQAITLRDSMANLQTGRASSGSSSSSSSGSKGRERSSTVGGGPLPNAGGVEVQYGLDPLVDLLLSATDEKTKWNVLATVTVLIDQPAARKQLVDSSLIQVLVSMLVDLLKGKQSKTTSPNDFEREERVSRRTSRLRSVIMAILSNLTSYRETTSEGVPQPLPECLTRETEVRLFVRLMRHTYDELKALERRESAKSGTGEPSDAIVSSPSFPGSASSVRAELVATLALLANITSWSDNVAEMLATSEAIAREITRGDSSASTSATVDLLTSLLDDTATQSAAATILTNISAKDERLCSLVATRSLIRKCTRALHRQPTPPDDTILTIACLLRNCSSIPTMARYMSTEHVSDTINDLPFNAAVDTIFRVLLSNVQEASPAAAMRRKKSLTKKKPGESLMEAEPLKKHNFVTHSFKSFHWCMHCTKFVWGLRNQGSRCSVCHYSAHDACVKLVDTPCPGYIITQSKEPPSPSGDRSSSLASSFRK
jgi:serine/threonine protein kinase